MSTRIQRSFFFFGRLLRAFCFFRSNLSRESRERVARWKVSWKIGSRSAAMSRARVLTYGTWTSRENQVTRRRARNLRRTRRAESRSFRVALSRAFSTIFRHFVSRENDEVGHYVRVPVSWFWAGVPRDVDSSGGDALSGFCR